MSLETVYQLAIEQAPSLAQHISVDLPRRKVLTRAVRCAMSIFGEWSENTLKYDGPLSTVYGRENYPGERYGVQARQTLNMSQFREMQRRGALFNRSGVTSLKPRSNFWRR